MHKRSKKFCITAYGIEPVGKVGASGVLVSATTGMAAGPVGRTTDA